MSTDDRRAPGAARIPFDALVEVGGALGPSFEAQAVDISEEGMQLRTAYLPETGQALTCRFDGGPGQSVLASGEVVWAHGADRGGEFAVRFTDMDAESVDSLKRICGVDRPKPVQPGSKVRLHIDGLASPMRAKIKDAHPSAVTVGSDLGFLQVGRQLELEDSRSGDKRPACIDRVDVAVDPTSRVPQLIVTLRYADVPSVEIEAPAAPADRHPGSPAPSGDDLAAVERASAQMKSAFARNAARVGPAMVQLAKRAATTVALLAQRRAGHGDDPGARRTTAPAPGGGLHTSGRRVVRGDAASASDPPRRSQDAEDGAATPRAAKFTRRRALVAGSVMTAAIVGAIVMKKVHHEPAAPPGAAAVESAAPVTAAANEAAPPAPPVVAAPAAPESAGAVASTAFGDDSLDSATHHKKHPHVAPFGNGPVHHGNVLHLKMDAPIESIEGAQQPTGFTVKLPGRRSLEAAAPLAARDSRIAAIKVSNDSAGAELTVTFRDGVPNYQVSAHGDVLAIALAPVGVVEETTAKKDEKGTKESKHGRHERDHESRGSTEER